MTKKRLLIYTVSAVFAGVASTVLWYWLLVEFPTIKENDSYRYLMDRIIFPLVPRFTRGDLGILLGFWWISAMFLTAFSAISFAMILIVHSICKIVKTDFR